MSGKMVPNGGSYGWSWTKQSTPTSKVTIRAQGTYTPPDTSLAEHIEPLADVDLSEVELLGADTSVHVRIPPDIFEPEHAQMEEAMQFAKLYGELRRVRDELKVMTEDRDFWLSEAERRKDDLRGAQGASQAAWRGDEGKVLGMLSSRLALGERSYGALDVHDDRDMVQEATEEALDLAVYLATQLIRLKESGA